jgi:hypothetical protein
LSLSELQPVARNLPIGRKLPVGGFALHETRVRNNDERAKLAEKSKGPVELPGPLRRWGTVEVSGGISEDKQLLRGFNGRFSRRSPGLS